MEKVVILKTKTKKIIESKTLFTTLFTMLTKESVIELFFLEISAKKFNILRLAKAAELTESCELRQGAAHTHVTKFEVLHQPERDRHRPACTCVYKHYHIAYIASVHSCSWAELSSVAAAAGASCITWLKNSGSGAKSQAQALSHKSATQHRSARLFFNF